MNPDELRGLTAEEIRQLSKQESDQMFDEIEAWAGPIRRRRERILLGLLIATVAMIALTALTAFT